MKKQLFWLVESNGDLSTTCGTLQQAMEEIEGDMEFLGKEDSKEAQYTITPTWMTEKQYEELPEA
jgi:hypothetical protein